MGEDLYRLVTTGLLGVTVLLLLVAVSQLGRLQKALRPGSTTEPSDDRPEPAPAATPSEAATPEAQPAPEAEAVPEAGPAESITDVPDEDGPFERDGRWWFRRDGELLVYDEQREEWVDPEHPLDEAKGWDAATQTAPSAYTHPPAEAEVDTPRSVTETAPQPVTDPEPYATPEPVAEPVQSTPEPVAEPVQSTPEPVAEPVQSTPEPAAAAPAETPEPASGGHWKCPSCGVVNGSTATSCRMCFTARP